MVLSRDRCYVVAEIGGNFTDYDTAVMLIDQAAQSGVDAVKLQTYKAENLVTDKAVFDMESIKGIRQIEYFKQYELDEDMHRKVYEYARSKGLDVFSSPSHYADLPMLERLGTDIYKIGADDAVNIPLLKEVARLGKPVMLSTGMCTMSEVQMAVNAILETGNHQVIILQTVSLYPTHDKDVNLNVLKSLMREFPDFYVGYSDHTMSIDACLFAAVLGAAVVEKHFTYDKNAKGPDHMHSATESEMTELVNKIRLYEKMRGISVKMPVADETKNRLNNRKSVIVIKDIKKGEAFSKENLDIKRPGTGIAPGHYENILGKTAVRDIKKDALLDWTDIAGTEGI